MLHLFAILATTYLQVCMPNLPVGARCVIEGKVFQFRCMVIAPEVRHCVRRIKRPTKDEDFHI